EFYNLKQLIYSRLHFGVRADLIVGDFNAPAGEQAYQTIVGNGEYVDQYFSVHPPLKILECATGTQADAIRK
ncbi:MAG: hypothetical protein U1D69_04125, partial [Polynucleobacter sp.]|nr:hypothetical protein [Polynucleobacter sp.]